MPLHFTCPKCGGHRLEEVMSGVTQSSLILAVREGGDIEYGDKSSDDGEVEQYQCLGLDCDFIVRCEGEANPINHCDDLYTWLQEEEARLQEEEARLQEEKARLQEEDARLQVAACEEEARLQEEDAVPGMTVRDLIAWLIQARNLDAIVGLCVGDYPYAPFIAVADESVPPGMDDDDAIGMVVIHIGPSDILTALKGVPDNENDLQQSNPCIRHARSQRDMDSRRDIANRLFEREDFPLVVKDTDGWQSHANRLMRTIYFEPEDGPDFPSLQATYLVEFHQIHVLVSCPEVNIRRRFRYIDVLL